MYTGKGSIIQGDKEICSGFYQIEKLSRPDKHTEQWGTFEVRNSDHSKLIEITNLLQSNPSVVLIIQDGRKFDIGANNVIYQPSDGFVKFRITFAPGSPEI